MEINITLVAQAIHFYIAYVIVDRLLLRPAVDTIENEQRRYNLLITAINDQLQLLKEKEINRYNQWQQFRQQVMVQIPDIRVEQEPWKIDQKWHVRPITQEEKERYKKEVVASLVRRLSNVS